MLRVLLTNQHAFHFHCISRWLKTRHGECLPENGVETCTDPSVCPLDKYVTSSKPLLTSVDNGSSKSTANRIHDHAQEMYHDNAMYIECIILNHSSFSRSTVCPLAAVEPALVAFDLFAERTHTSLERIADPYTHLSFSTVCQVARCPDCTLMAPCWRLLLLLPIASDAHFAALCLGKFSPLVDQRLDRRRQWLTDRDGDFPAEPRYGAWPIPRFWHHRVKTCFSAHVLCRQSNGKGGHSRDIQIGIISGMTSESMMIRPLLLSSFPADNHALDSHAPLEPCHAALWSDARLTDLAFWKDVYLGVSVKQHSRHSPIRHPEVV